MSRAKKWRRLRLEAIRVGVAEAMRVGVADTIRVEKFGR